MTSPVLAPPTSFTFRTNRQQTLTWTVQDADGNPVVGLTVTATLYANRDSQNPTASPGTPDLVFTNLSLPETPINSGVYIGLIPANFNPQPALYGFVTVVTSKDQSSAVVDATEVPSVVIFPQDSIDLCGL